MSAVKEFEVYQNVFYQGVIAKVVAYNPIGKTYNIRQLNGVKSNISGEELFDSYEDWKAANPDDPLSKPIDLLAWHKPPVAPRPATPARKVTIIASSLTPALPPTMSVRDLIPHPRNLIIYGHEDVTELMEQIVKSDWIKPIVVNPANNRIISGHRRWMAARDIGLSVVPVEYRTFANETDELEALLLENHSREKSPEQKVREGEVWAEIEGTKAQERMTAGINQHSPTPNLAEASKGETREKVAQKVDMRRTTFDKAKKVVEAADSFKAVGETEKAADLLNTLNKKSVDAAYKSLVATAKQAEHQLKVEAAQQAAVAPQELSTYSVLYIDPPWEFEVYSKATGSGRSAASHYDTLTLEDMKALPLQKLMNEDCAVFLWTTWPTLAEAMELAEAWGLTYKTCAFNWVKMNKNQTEKPFTGMGYWTRANSEPCLLFTRGNPSRQAKDVAQAFVDWTDETVATPIGPHSEKPTAIYERIEALLDGPYCEVFARECREGWAAIGNEIDGRDIREVLSDDN